MSQVSELLGVKPAPHTRVVGAVSAAHFVSHYYILLLAPLLADAPEAALANTRSASGAPR